MKKPTKPRRGDFTQVARSIVEEATSEPLTEHEDAPKKNPAAVELGRRGGLRGGKARAEKLSPEERSEIARKAAAARWRGKK